MFKASQTRGFFYRTYINHLKINKNNKKSMKELLNAILKSPLAELGTMFKEPLPENTHKAKIALELIKSAESGNIKAFNALMKMIDE
jgi:hypothetical protein